MSTSFLLRLVAAGVWRIPSAREYASMKFICKHCGATTFRLLAGADGRPAAECLKCGRASSFDQSAAQSPSVPPGKPKAENK